MRAIQEGGRNVSEVKMVWRDELSFKYFILFNDGTQKEVSASSLVAMGLAPPLPSMQEEI